jgi:hypothetical protein
VLEPLLQLHPHPGAVVKQAAIVTTGVAAAARGAKVASFPIGNCIMAPIPAFDARGFLPPFIGQDGTTPDRSPYEGSLTELVTAFGTTQSRKQLLSGLLDYRELLGRLGYTDGLQFIDGSFVENVEAREQRDPEDIDVFSFLFRPLRYRSDPVLWASTGFPEWSREVADRKRNKQRFKLDTYAIALDEHGPLTLIKGTVYWYSLFAHKRFTHEWKGFVCIRLNTSDDATARMALWEESMPARLTRKSLEDDLVGATARSLA